VADLAQAGLAVSRNRFVARLATRLAETLEAFAAGGFAAVAPDYAALDLLRGRPLRIADAHGTYEGMGDGVDTRGALRVRHGDIVRHYDSAEVTVRPA
jgi:BirA family biotin operon repressor/biotin-[acetyl-CoA-carboxylase] ligase